MLVIVLQKVLLLHLPHALPQPEQTQHKEDHTVDEDSILMTSEWISVDVANTFRCTRLSA